MKKEKKRFESFSDLLDNTVRRHHIHGDHGIVEEEEFEELDEEEADDVESEHENIMRNLIFRWMARIALIVEIAFTLVLSTAYICPQHYESEAPMRFLVVTPLIEIPHYTGVAYDLTTATLRLQEKVLEPFLLSFIPIILAILSLLLRDGTTPQHITLVGSILLFLLLLFML